MAERICPVAIAFGTSHWRSEASNFPNYRSMIQVLQNHDINLLDTARLYTNGASEKAIGSLDLHSAFKIITKPCMAMKPGGATAEGILADWKLSSAALKTDRVQDFILHTPAFDTPIAETMEGVQKLYLAGHFVQFGLSNFSATEVEEVYAYAKGKGYVLPTVYQGVYSLVHRSMEKDLLPTLRKLGISFQAYSPLACGFLARVPDGIRKGEGNFNNDTLLGKIMQEMYGRPSYFNFLEEFGKLADESAVSKVGMAYRWAVWNSALGETGDCVVLSASSAAQLEETLGEVEKGPLEEWVVERLSKMWKEVESDVPGNNHETFKKLMAAGAF